MLNKKTIVETTMISFTTQKFCSFRVSDIKKIVVVSNISSNLASRIIDVKKLG
jgi:hypothetical protein